MSKRVIERWARKPPVNGLCTYSVSVDKIDKILRGLFNDPEGYEQLGREYVTWARANYVHQTEQFPFDIGIVYEYHDERKNRYAIVGHGEGDVIIIERLKDNNRGMAGMLMKSSRREVQRQYDQGELRVVYENEPDLDPTHYDSWDDYYNEARDYVDGAF